MAEKPVVYIDNWYGAHRGCISQLCIVGAVTGHPRKEDGTVIRTGTVLSAKGRTFETRRTIYKLGAIDKEYRKWLKENKPSWDWRNPITSYEGE